MSSSASEDLTSAHRGSADICSSDYACNSDDIQVPTNSEKDDDPDSAELIIKQLQQATTCRISFTDRVMSGPDTNRGITKEATTQDD